MINIQAMFFTRVSGAPPVIGFPVTVAGVLVNELTKVAAPVSDPFEMLDPPTTGF
ncbi:MAG: hypothetical protein WDN46_03425 [Methylocella sp.]